ncbi:MAG TPA: CHAT domain-containing protein, partial [Herpetosiphonaceae bacterium]|nr:CHAT domain-containing protein [Herpetosiphonaceae bacterium]
MPQCRHCDVLSLPTSRFCRMCGKPLGEAEQVGALAFERQGMVDWVAAGEFGSLLYNAHIRLAVLLACESARISGRTVWSGLAPKLLLAGVPAVLGMQYPVYDDYANLFARTFYASLLRTGDVVAAMRAARRADVREAWYSPVLYLRRRRAPSAAEAALPAFQQRAVDTAAPEAAEAGSTFLVRLWIRRPGTAQRSEAQLRAELDVPEGIAVRTKEDVAEVKFAPVPGRALRRGEVDVRMDAIGCDVQRGEIKLFVDEHLDAPPAIFVVRAAAPGRARLLFNLIQDGGQIASVVHHVTVYAPGARVPAASTRMAVASHLVETTTGEQVSTVPAPVPVEAPKQPYPRPLPPAPAPLAPAPSAGPPPPVLPAPVGVSRWTTPAFAAGGWAGTGAVKAIVGVATAGGPPVSRWTDLLLALVAGLVVAWSLRRSDPRLRAGQVALIAGGWTLAWAALPVFAGVLESTTTGRIAAGVA